MHSVYACAYVFMVNVAITNVVCSFIAAVLGVAAIMAAAQDEKAPTDVKKMPYCCEYSVKYNFI